MPNPAGASQPPQRPRSILMLEDDSDLAATLKEFFLNDGYAVTHAANGVDGLKRIMSGDYNLILCDMLMPHLAGDMFYAAVERVKPNLCKRFIFMTGHQGDPRWDAFVRKVGGIMLFKPFELHVLIEAIQTVLRKSNQL
jgi:DNA-binding response OmpR family regulator